MPIRLTRAVKGLLVACFVGFLIQHTGDQFFGTHLLGWLGLVPERVFQDHRIWQLFTYSFLHHDVMHLFFNFMMLAFIGSELEIAWGTARFLRYYFFCATSVALFYLVLQKFMGGAGMLTPLVGASGAIYGLLMAYGLIFGERILLFMLMFPMKAKQFVWVLALIELLSTVYSAGGGITSIAHLIGMVAGFSFLWGRAGLVIFRKNRENLPKRPKRKRAQHLKLIVDNEGDLDAIDENTDHFPKTWH